MRDTGRREGRAGRFARWARERGVVWTGLTIIHRLLARVHAPRRLTGALERTLAEIERRRFIVGTGTVGSMSQTIEENRFIWDRWDWSAYGEEWTEQVREYRQVDPADWKARLIHEAMLEYAPPDGTVVEIGPGPGGGPGSCSGWPAG